MNTVYPTLTDPSFQERIYQMEDFKIFKTDPVESIHSQEEFEKKLQTLCQFEKTNYQHLVSQYISERSPFRSLLLYHGLGTGKSCSAITIAETFLVNQRLHDEPFVWIISKKALKKSFEKEIFQTLLLMTPEFLKNQCTRDTYYQMIPDHDQLTAEKLMQRIYKIIKSRYRFFGYEKFANTIQSYIEEGTIQDKVKNKLIIIDEAHNIRNLEMSGEQQKKIIEPFLKCIQLGRDNRLVLLSATPMFNEPEEILWLLSLLTLNDKYNNLLTPFRLPKLYTNGKANKQTFELIAKLSSYYISYVKGTNPFTFAARISPTQLNIPILDKVPPITFQGEAIPKTELNWLTYIKDGLVPSVLQGIQLQNLTELLDQKLKISTALLRQLNNITFVKQVTKEITEYVEGKEGIFSIFKRKGDELPMQVEYINSKEPILNPAFGKLADYSAKLATLSNLIKKSKGPIVIYSNFIWGGLVPIAIMLEHMGFSRQGEHDLLFMQNKVTERVSFKNPKYCILSGENEKDIMGDTRIDKLLEVINTTDNIKVILMSPVASEGLSFKNIREMHILDPWYHLNTIEQAIGRGIRNCSHSSLPFDQRNVSVFLHTTVFPDNSRETEDLHAYRLAAIKQSQISAVDKVIKENALDCKLLKDINYIPKELFQFQTTITTSHGNVIPYQFGDDEMYNIQCKESEKVPRDTRAFREESYSSYIPTLQERLKKKLKENYEKNNILSYTYEELAKLVHVNKEVAHRTIEQSLYPYTLWKTYGLFYHMQQFIIADFSETSMRPTRLQLDITKEIIEEIECNLETIFESFALDTEDIATIKLYQALDSNCWKKFAEKLILNPSSISPRIKPILDILEKQGALLTSGNKYIGYVNIFSPEDSYEVLLLDNNTFREATENEISRLIRDKNHFPFPDPTKVKIVKTIGLIQRYKNAKDPTSPFRFQLKLGLNNEKVKRSGIVCDTGLKKPEIEKELAQFITLLDSNGKKIKMNMSQMCFSLMVELLKTNRIWIPPMYKPK